METRPKDMKVFQEVFVLVNPCKLCKSNKHVEIMQKAYKQGTTDHLYFRMICTACETTSPWRTSGVEAVEVWNQLHDYHE